MERYYVLLVERVGAMVHQGKSLDEIKAADAVRNANQALLVLFRCGEIRQRFLREAQQIANNAKDSRSSDFGRSLQAQAASP